MFLSTTIITMITTTFYSGAWQHMQQQRHESKAVLTHTHTTGINAVNKTKYISKVFPIHAVAPQMDKEFDDTLSQRPLELDPAGYFIINIDNDEKIIIVEHYSNTINDQGMMYPKRMLVLTVGPYIRCDGYSYQLYTIRDYNGDCPMYISSIHTDNQQHNAGLACDDETGEVISCKGGVSRTPRQLFRYDHHISSSFVQGWMNI